jgi:hypothetical protein
MDGSVYKGNQGTGYATTFGNSQALDTLANQNYLKAQKSKSGKTKGIDFDTDGVWHYYSGQAQQEIDDWYNKTAQIQIDEGIDDPWNTSNKKAINQQIEAGRIKAGLENVKQAQEAYNNAMKDIAVRGDEYDPEYIEAVKNFPLQTNFETIKQGNFQFPFPRFKEPTNIHNNFLVAEYKRLREETEGEIPTDAALQNSVNAYFTAPEHQNDYRGLKQQYAKMTDEDKKIIKGIKDDQGFAEDWQALAYYNLRSMFYEKNRNAQLDAAKLAEDVIPIDIRKWKTGESGSLNQGYLLVRAKKQKKLRIMLLLDSFLCVHTY